MRCSDQLRKQGTSTWDTVLTATARVRTFFSRLVPSPVKVWSEPASLLNTPPFGGLLLGSSLAHRAFSISFGECQSVVVCVAGFPFLLWNTQGWLRRVTG